MDNKKATKGKRFDLWGCTKNWKICTMLIFSYLYSFDSFFLSLFLSLCRIGAVKPQHVLLISTSLLVSWYRGPNQDTAGIATHGSRWSGGDKCAKCYRGLPLSCISLRSFELKANWKRAFLFNLTQLHNKETGCFYWIRWLWLWIISYSNSKSMQSIQWKHSAVFQKDLTLDQRVKSEQSGSID